MSTATATTQKVAAEIRAEMARQAVTQLELAPRVPMSVTALGRRLSGRAPLTVPELVGIARALRVSAASLLARAEDEPPAAVGGGRGPSNHVPMGRNGL